jgi:tyrosinase
MRIALALNGSTTTTTNYLSWTPSPCEVRLSDMGGAAAPVTVRLRNQRTGVGGQVIFYESPSSEPTDEFELQLPQDGAPTQLWLGGKHGYPSVADSDGAIEVVDAQTGAVLATTPLMVRIRKDANILTPAERSRFLSALAELNDKGQGRFNELRDMHRETVEAEAHGGPAFLPWHRAYMLDFERELQAFDSSVALPYWNFQLPAPNVFHPDFMGAPDGTSTPVLSSTNPLVYWRTDGGARIRRAPRFTPSGKPALRTDAQTLAWGDDYRRFWFGMEDDPHGFAHTSFRGDIARPDTAPMDPLFFLLHTNVDRLWASWQVLNGRWDAASRDTYPFQGSAGATSTIRVGHNVEDTMWPWDASTASPRPSTPPPGGALAPSPVVTAPGAVPTVRSMIDYQGRMHPENRLGYDYDDIPY